MLGRNLGNHLVDQLSRQPVDQREQPLAVLPLARRLIRPRVTQATPSNGYPVPGHGGTRCVVTFALFPAQANAASFDFRSLS